MAEFLADRLREKLPLVKSSQNFDQLNSGHKNSRLRILIVLQGACIGNFMHSI